MPMPPGLLPVGGAVSATGNTSAGIPRPKPIFGNGNANPLAALRNQYEPLEWSDFFDSREMINDQVPVYVAGNQGHVYLCLHGAGHTALSFAALAEQLKSASTVVAFDWRGHGDHRCENEH